MVKVEQFVKAVKTMYEKTVETAEMIDGRKPSVLRLPSNDVSWLTGQDTSTVLFVRPAYQYMYILLRDVLAYSDVDYQVIVSGSCGIGKRAFLNYVVFRLRHESNPPAIVLDLEGFFGLINVDGTVEQGVRAYSFRTALMDRNTVYICDAVSMESGPLCEEGIRAKTIVATQPVRERTKKFQSMYECVSFTMPVWSEQELEQCRLACYPHVTKPIMEALTQLWGGFVRWVLAEATTTSRSQFAKSLEQLTLEKTGEIVTKAGFVETNEAFDDGHYLIRLDVDPNNTFQASTTTLCSEVACSRLLDDVHNKDDVVAFLKKHREVYNARYLLDMVQKQFLTRMVII
ncbi:hypothetical protein Poli38472_001332 [Pythium oligandrum]|uniref:Uncharacterized protein n=1 Tax=Pythium oligandrum TaxID=41045 RepID=A0A8K1CV33_PYTOL|nr:hypothetical protein Poli38472_001332 [Pythium oligandrum]|eukprot:TMW69176.1 hypothetical protein Poli38472_001332 [Pythium oligandrum]